MKMRWQWQAVPCVRNGKPEVTLAEPRSGARFDVRRPYLRIEDLAVYSLCDCSDAVDQISPCFFCVVLDDRQLIYSNYTAIQVTAE